MSDQRPIVALVTSPAGDADGIAEALVESRAAACVNIVPSVRSIYWWQGKIERESESLLVIKTTSDNLDRLHEVLIGVHPYEVFELIALKIEGGNQAYLDWIASSIKAD